MNENEVTAAHRIEILTPYHCVAKSPADLPGSKTTQSSLLWFGRDRGAPLCAKAMLTSAPPPTLEMSSRAFGSSRAGDDLPFAVCSCRS